jgi:large subunit ribosomal protein L29
MKMHDIRQLSREEINQHLRDARDEFQNLRFQLATHQLDNQVKVRLVRKDVARLLTVIHEFELGLRKEPEKPGK